MAKERNKTIRVQAVQFLRLKTVAKGKKTMPPNATRIQIDKCDFSGESDRSWYWYDSQKIEYPKKRLKKATKNATTSTTNHAQQ